MQFQVRINNFYKQNLFKPLCFVYFILFIHPVQMQNYKLAKQQQRFFKIIGITPELA